MSAGRLVGIGVGPGDPDLLTLKAINALQSIDLLAYLSSVGSESMARAVVGDHLPAGLAELGLEAPMREGTEARASFYEDFAARLRPELDQGKTVGVLCLGDPMFYGSFIYLLDRLRHAYSFDIIPGITSVSAAAARTGR
ncbi:MAG: SAM-dependent methyltransferase, partial [Pseudomonadota bacterium]